MAITWSALPVGALSARFFLSYRSLDARVAAAVEGELVRRGQLVWRDRRVLRSGDLWRDEIRDGLTTCDDVIVLLTPAAADSAEVRAEIQIARELSRRVHVFSTFSFHDHPIYELIRDINIIGIEPWSNDDANVPADEIGRTIAGQVLDPPVLAHPLDPRDFERIHSRRLLVPPGSDGMPPDMARRYASYAASSVSATSMLVLNYALLFLHIGDFAHAQAMLQRLSRESPTALAHYYLSMALIEGKRPSHQSPRIVDDAVKAAEEAFRESPSPLIAIQLAGLYWDSGAKRGPNTAEFMRQALMALPAFPQDRPEARRLLALSSLRKPVSLPFDRDSVVKLITQFADGG